MVSFLRICATSWLSLIGWAVLDRETPWGQPWTPVLTLPHVRDGLRVLLMAVWCPFRRLSMCRPVHRQLMRNELLDLTTIVPTTAYHQRNYAETYSRFMQGRKMIRLLAIADATSRVDLSCMRACVGLLHMKDVVQVDS